MGHAQDHPMVEERPGAASDTIPAMSALARQVAELRVRALARVPGFRRSPEALREQARPYLSMPPGARVDAYPSTRAPRALVVRGDVEDPWSGGSVHRVLVAQDRRSARARRWLGGVLGELLADPPPGLELSLAAADREHLPLVDDDASHVHCAILGGRVHTARRGLGAVDVAASLEAEGLGLRRLEAEDVDTVLGWKRAWFTAHPEFGSHCASPAYLDAERAEMTEELAADVHDLWVLTRRGDPAGFFSFVPCESASWGRFGSLDLLLTAPLRGRGLARVAYAHMLERMRDRGVVALRGGTSQPGVLHLARVMKRPTVAWVIKAGPAVVPRGLLVGG
jgi:hypothetical protein